MDGEQRSRYQELVAASVAFKEQVETQQSHLQELISTAEGMEHELASNPLKREASK
jgi:hypothetical protein